VGIRREILEHEKHAPMVLFQHDEEGFSFLALLKWVFNATRRDSPPGHVKMVMGRGEPLLVMLLCLKKVV